MIVAALFMLAGARETPILVGGSEAALRQFAQAARGCGYAKSAVTRASFGTLVVTLPNDFSSSTTTALDCSLRWMLAHPKLKLGFLGNEAYAR